MTSGIHTGYYPSIIYLTPGGNLAQSLIRLLKKRESRISKPKGAGFGPAKNPA